MIRQIRGDFWALGMHTNTAASHIDDYGPFRKQRINFIFTLG